MEGTKVAQRSLVLILARDLADKLATAMFVVDRDGTLVYFNEAAADILGLSFGEAGRMRVEDWSRGFTPSEEGYSSPDEIPLVVALRDRVPDHRDVVMRGRDGKDRTVAVTAFPLFARPDEFVGAAAIFWQRGGPPSAEARGLPPRSGAGSADPTSGGAGGRWRRRGRRPSGTEGTPPASRCARPTAG